ncbi:MAG: hypothetical protein ACE366_14730 [Bradymonadia bacterium]
MTPAIDRAAIDRAALVEREDLVAFINAGMVATGQAERLSTAYAQRVSLDFLHQYIEGNYPTLYARCLALGAGGAAGLNRVNRMRIVSRLLERGAPADPARRAEEAHLIALTLDQLPPHRVYRMFAALARSRVNNRRVRAAIRGWLGGRDLVFDAVKYRRWLGIATRHGHVALKGELGTYVFRGPGARVKWATPQFDRVRQARRGDSRSIFALPLSVAEGYAGAHGISRQRLLRGVDAHLTAHERTRLVNAAGVKSDLSRMPLGRLCRFILARDPEQRTQSEHDLRGALSAVAGRVAEQSHISLGSVVAVLDRGVSAYGAEGRQNRPLSVAMGASQVLRGISRHYRAIWTDTLRQDELMLTVKGRGNLEGAMQQALALRPDWIFVVSDAFEEGRHGRAAKVAKMYEACFGQAQKPLVVLFNPVYDAEELMPRPLGPEVPVLGLTEPEHLPAMLSFARFASGACGMAELQSWLAGQSQRARARWIRRLAQRQAAAAA